VAPTDYKRQHCSHGADRSEACPASSGQPAGYDLNPTKFGQNQSIVTNVSNYGKQTEIYDSVSMSRERVRSRS
jgi:hypothetical protein